MKKENFYCSLLSKKKKKNAGLNLIQLLLFLPKLKIRNFFELNALWGVKII